MPDISMQVRNHNAPQHYHTVQGILGAPKGIPGVPIPISCSCLVTQLQICMRPKAMQMTILQLKINLFFYLNKTNINFLPQFQDQTPDRKFVYKHFISVELRFLTELLYQLEKHVWARIHASFAGQCMQGTLPEQVSLNPALELAWRQIKPTAVTSYNMILLHFMTPNTGLTHS